MRIIRIQILVVGFMLMIVCSAVSMATDQEYVLTIKDHKFSPPELVVPAEKRIEIRVENHDATREEFESYELNREQEIEGNDQIVVFIGPLKPGKYKYFGEFHQDTAQGIITAE